MRIKYDNTRNNSNIVNSMKINITKHALERFLSRDPSPTPIKDPEKTIEKLFKKAIPITITIEMYWIFGLVNSENAEFPNETDN